MNVIISPFTTAITDIAITLNVTQTTIIITTITLSPSLSLLLGVEVDVKTEPLIPGPAETIFLTQGTYACSHAHTE